MTQFTSVSKLFSIDILKTAGVIIAGLTISFLPGKAVQAGTLHNNWYYAFDSLTDSITGNYVGGTKYEIAGMAYGQKDGQSIFVISTKLKIKLAKLINKLPI